MVFMDFEELKQKGKQCTNLKEALDLELSYDTSKGTPTVVQDYFRKLKVDFVVDAFCECNLEHSMLKFYNYSMQGYCQVMYDLSYEKRIHDHLDKLHELLGVPVNVMHRKEEVVINIGEGL